MKVTSLRKGSKYHGYNVVRRLDSKKKAYRQVYLCTHDGVDCILVRFIRKRVPNLLNYPLEDFCLPIEYFFFECYNSMYPVDVLPNILSCDFDDDEAWYVREYLSGTSLSEEIQHCHKSNEGTTDKDLLDAFCGWLTIEGYKCSKLLPAFVKYNLSVDNLFIAPDHEGRPKLVLYDLESALSLESGLLCADLIKVDSRFIPPEFLCDTFDYDKSYLYTFAMILAFTLRGKFPNEDVITGEAYEHMIPTLIEKEFIFDGVDISKERKDLILKALDSNLDNRPSFDEFVKIWSEDKSDKTTETDLNDTHAIQNNINEYGLPNKYDDMFHKGTGRGFADIAGMDDIKHLLLAHVIYPLKYPDVAHTYGISTPNAILMYGPPGCGKSFIAKKTCEESNCLYAKIKASDLGGQWHREGLSNIGELFKAAERQSKLNNTPVFIIIDEADGIIQIRNQEMSAGAAAETNQFLTELETCSQRGIIVIATSNDPRQIDPAALRSGRLGDLSVHIPLPDAATKSAILKLELSKLPCETIDFDEMISLTKNFSSSDVAGVARKSAVYAMSHMISSIEKGTPTQTVPITGDIVRKVIMETTPSIPDYELQKQIQIHESFSNMRKNKTSKIGFHSSKVG